MILLYFPRIWDASSWPTMAAGAPAIKSSAWCSKRMGMDTPKQVCGALRTELIYVTTASGQETQKRLFSPVTQCAYLEVGAVIKKGK